MAIEDTIYVLGKALDKERITLDVFLKVTPSVNISTVKKSLTEV